MPRPEIFLEQIQREAMSLPLAPPKVLPPFVELVAKYGAHIAITHEAAIAYDNVLGKVRCPSCCCPPSKCLRACPCTRGCPVLRSLLLAPARSCRPVLQPRIMMVCVCVCAGSSLRISWSINARVVVGRDVGTATPPTPSLLPFTSPGARLSPIPFPCRAPLVRLLVCSHVPWRSVGHRPPLLCGSYSCSVEGP